MRLILLEEKISLLAPIFLVLLIFFIPVSSSMKSILLVPTLMTLLFTPYYRKNLYYAYNTLWARAALILFLYVLIASLWSEASLQTRFYVIDKYSKLIFLPIFAVGFVKPQTRKWALNSYLLVMALLCILSFLKAKKLIILNTDDPGEVFYNHIATGYMIALGVYLAGLQVFKVEMKFWHRFFYLLIAIVGTYQIFFLNTGRTGYLVYAVLMSALILQKMPLRKAILGLVLFCSTIILVYSLSSVMQMSALTSINDIKQIQQHQANNSLGFRIQFHQYAKSLFEEHPITGIGTGGFQYRFSHDQPVPAWGKKLNEPHSQYWLILTEQGLIGLVLFFLFIGILFTTLFQLKETRPILLGILVSFCMVSFSDTVFCYSPIGLLLIFFSALCFGELIEKERNALVRNESINIAAQARDDENDALAHFPNQ